MSIRFWLKEFAEALPLPLALVAKRVPFAVRLGLGYLTTSGKVRRVLAFCEDDYIEWVTCELERTVRSAVRQSKFYKSLFNSVGYDVRKVFTLEMFYQLPIVTKEMLRKVPLDERSEKRMGCLKVNTGGTSGSPLAFLVDRNAFAREWAHMHYIWERAGYRASHLKLSIRGKRLKNGEAFRFNPVHNELVVNASVPHVEVIQAIRNSLWMGQVRWIHGYPSLVAEFCSTLAALGSEVVAQFRRPLVGVLLGSEYPASVYRDRIARVLSVRVVSWYGHSEMAILAAESALGIYECLPSYGFSEIISDDSGSADGRLIVTAFGNSVHPFIRYDTGDRVSQVNGPVGCPSFRVTEGRVGDFIVDSNGVRHSLTAIIFGRHHAAFECIEHVQVRSSRPGVAELFVVPKQGATVEEICGGFDLGDLDIKWSYNFIERPIRSAGGKVLLKVNDYDGPVYSSVSGYFDR